MRGWTEEKELGPDGQILSLEAGFWALRLEGSRGWTEEREKEKKKEKFLLCESIGHRPLRGRCPKGPAIQK